MAKRFVNLNLLAIASMERPARRRGLRTRDRSPFPGSEGNLRSVRIDYAGGSVPVQLEMEKAFSQLGKGETPRATFNAPSQV
jgi:hypothetical protein